jgi:hypothetical protein
VKPALPERSLPEAKAFNRPYPPSWFDRFTAWVDRLPGPAWLAYLALAVLGTAMLILAASAGGAYRPGPLLAFHIWVGGQFAYMLALMHYLDRSAGGALDAFRPVLEGADRSTIDDLRYRLTTLPPRATLLATLAGAAFGLSLPYFFLGTAIAEPHTLSAAFSPFGFPASSLSFVRFLQAFFVMTEAFSVPTGLTSAGLVLYTYAWFSAPRLSSSPSPSAGCWASSSQPWRRRHSPGLFSASIAAWWRRRNS